MLFGVANWQGKASMYNPLALAKSLEFVLAFSTGKNKRYAKSLTVHQRSVKQEINPGTVMIRLHRRGE